MYGYFSCMSASHEYVQYGQEEGNRSLETGVRDDSETPYQVLEMKLGPLKEQPMYLTAEPPLQLSYLCLDHPLITQPLMQFIPVELYWTIPVVRYEGDKFFYNRKFLSPERQAKGLFQYTVCFLYICLLKTQFSKLISQGIFLISFLNGVKTSFL